MSKMSSEGYISQSPTLITTHYPMFSSYGPLLKALRSFCHPVSTEAAMRWYFHAHAEADMPHSRSSFAGLASLELYLYPLEQTTYFSPVSLKLVW